MWRSMLINVNSWSTVYVYQRRYTFRCEATFLVDAWGRQTLVGSQGNLEPQRAICEVEVWTKEIVTVDEPLIYEHKETFNGQTRYPLEEAVRKFEELPQRAKDTLRSRFVQTEMSWSSRLPYRIPTDKYIFPYVKRKPEQDGTRQQPRHERNTGWVRRRQEGQRAYTAYESEEHNCSGSRKTV